MKFLGNIRIGMKIAGGSSILIMLLLALGGVAMLGLNTADTDFDAYRLSARQSNAFGRIQANALEVRLNAREFLLAGREEDAREVGDRSGKVEQLAAEARTLYDTPAALATLDTVVGRIRDYQTTFGTVTERKRERDRLGLQLNQLGERMETSLVSVMAAARAAGEAQTLWLAAETLRPMLLARIYANRFATSHDPAAAERATAELKAAGANVRTLGESSPPHRATAEQVAQALDDYGRTFAQVARVTAEQDSLVRERLDRIGPEIDHLTEEQKLASIHHQNELGPRADADIAGTLARTQGIVALALVLGLMVAVVIARAIARPITAMTAAMRRLAEGDLETAVPALDHGDEIGAMAKAVEIFKLNGREVARLKAEQEALEQRAAADKARMMNQLANSFEDSVQSVVGGVSAASSQMRANAQALSALAEQTNRQAVAVAAAAEEASTNVGTVATAAEELRA